MERVQLHLEYGMDRVKAWAWGNPAAWSYRRVTIGTLADGRWFAGAVVCRDRAHAEQVAAGWMTGDGWRETPASYGSDGKPTTPGWVRRGGDWFRA